MPESGAPWRERLLVGVVAFGVCGTLWMFVGSPPEVQATLGLLALAFGVGIVGVLAHYRARLTPRLFTANLALGTLVFVVIAGMVVVGDRLGRLGPWPALEAHWLGFVVGVLGIGGATFTWTRARGSPADPVLPPSAPEPEPAPPPGAALAEAPDWQAIDGRLRERADVPRLQSLEALRRIDAALRTGGAPEAILVLRQEVIRLEASSKAENQEDDDLLSQGGELVEWAVQKLPELPELDASDLLMGKVIADIRALHTSVEHRFVDHRELLPIHPIDRPTALEKCAQRAAAARAALPLLQANGMRLSEALVAAEPSLAPFASVTGLQVVSLGEGQGWVTFEGNGRREGLRMAFGDELGVLVEVRVFRFADARTQETVARRVRRVRRWKGLE